MKVTRNTSEQLIVEDRPWLTGLGIGALILFFTGAGLFSVFDGELGGLVFFVGTALGALAFWAFVRRLMVIFDRASGRIELRRAWLGGQSSDAFDLNALEHGDVEFREEYSQGKVRRRSRATLVMAVGHEPRKIPLTEHYSGGRSADTVCEAINSWVRQGRG